MCFSRFSRPPGLPQDRPKRLAECFLKFSFRTNLRKCLFLQSFFFKAFSSQRFLQSFSSLLKAFSSKLLFKAPSLKAFRSKRPPQSPFSQSLSLKAPSSKPLLQSPFFKALSSKLSLSKLFAQSLFLLFKASPPKPSLQSSSSQAFVTFSVKLYSQTWTFFVAHKSEILGRQSDKNACTSMAM